MTAGASSSAPARRSRRTTVLWSVLVAALSAAAWLAWLSWADAEEELAAWQVTGVLLTLLAAAVVGVPRLGAAGTWLLLTAPFAAFGAWSLFGSDPLGPVGAVVWVFWSGVAAAVMIGLVVGVRAALRALISRRAQRS